MSVPWDETFFRWRGPEDVIREFRCDEDYDDLDDEYEYRGASPGPAVHPSAAVRGMRLHDGRTAAWILRDGDDAVFLILLRSGS